MSQAHPKTRGLAHWLDLNSYQGLFTRFAEFLYRLAIDPYVTAQRAGTGSLTGFQAGAVGHNRAGSFEPSQLEVGVGIC